MIKYHPEVHIQNEQKFKGKNFSDDLKIVKHITLNRNNLLQVLFWVREATVNYGLSTGCGYGFGGWEEPGLFFLNPSHKASQRCLPVT